MRPFTQPATLGPLQRVSWPVWSLGKDPQFWPLSSERKHIMTPLRLMECSTEPRKKESTAQKKDGSSVWSSGLGDKNNLRGESESNARSRNFIRPKLVQQRHQHAAIAVLAQAHYRRNEVRRNCHVWISFVQSWMPHPPGLRGRGTSGWLSAQISKATNHDGMGVH